MKKIIFVLLQSVSMLHASHRDDESFDNEKTPLLASYKKAAEQTQELVYCCNDLLSSYRNFRQPNIKNVQSRISAIHACIKSGADVNVVFKDNEQVEKTPLVCAADCGLIGLAEILVQHGAKELHRNVLGQSNKTGQEYLYANAKRTLFARIAAGVDINVTRQSDGSTLLHDALFKDITFPAYRGSFFMDLLLAGARSDLSIDGGKTVEDVLRDMLKLDLVDLNKHFQLTRNDVDQMTRLVKNYTLVCGTKLQAAFKKGMQGDFRDFTEICKLHDSAMPYGDIDQAMKQLRCFLSSEQLHTDIIPRLPILSRMMYDRYHKTKDLGINADLGFERIEREEQKARSLMIAKVLKK